MVAKHESEQPTQSPQVFMLRLWTEDMGGGQTDWRGRVQHMNSGEARYFRDWRTLESFVEELLRGLEADGTAAGEGARPLHPGV